MPVDPPRPRGPSLNALRAFESAARLGGFSKASEELNVSPGAIAQHVKTLEDWADAPLFERHAQGLSLTSVGAAALAPLTDAFDRMGEAVQSLRAYARPAVLHIAALPAVAQLWLAPILPRLRAELPGQEISVTALEAPPNLAREAYDMALFFASEGGEVIEEDEIFPVCTPQIARAIGRVEDLALLPCLRDSTWAGDWELWALATKAAHPLRPRGPSFSLYALAVEEALGGAGVLMAHSSLLRAHIASGRLVNPLDSTLKTGLALRLFRRPGAPTQALEHLAKRLLAEGQR
ncbi:LysR family transcriptional regulator [Aquicoccus sp. G2-2]|uniref:LysR family transcriptional regulator n=1 Tax=Aquicoccus sp. G2-2 TaxID=3092120 RepID=UPI002ADFA245|nr:LysR family transcriptional regulator [Aquicoccus sp. G2-2]MEA1112400.1 LysR family transcriptional regulator [Aquicoccus sp. G2-2]